ncbi:MAG TPA: PHP domain-containing protein [Thermodesulfovibrionales bacterium]|nr:PHP domain-containing protein [Thermodesulfovibrionales bacterium]
MHTCLSPCAEIDMSPREIVSASLGKGLDLIAVTDHNSAENAEATQRAAKGTRLEVLAGMEITSAEEVHVLALFDSPEHAGTLQDIVQESLPSGENDEKLYGHQIIANEHNEVVGFNRRLLIAATSLGVHAIVERIRSLGGISIASHVDKEAFSVLSQLGFIPDDLRFDALELSPRMIRSEAEAAFAALKGFPWVSFSDAHYIRDIGRRVTTFTLREATIEEMKKALNRADGRDLFWG